MKKNKSRQIGTIRQSYPHQHQIPRSIMDMTINNKNPHHEMKQLNTNRQLVFQKYEQIIKDLQQIIQTLQQKNIFINQQRLRLLNQNAKLHSQLQTLKQNCIITDTYLKKRSQIFQIVLDQQQQSTIPHSLVRIHKNNNNNLILQQQQFYLDNKSHQLFFCNLPSANISISQQFIQQQRTPCLNNNKTPSTLIQCRSTNNQAPLRIFYLLLLQQQTFIVKIRQLLKFCIQDQSKIFLHLLPNHNAMWGQILDKFLDLIIKGQFQNQIQVIQYISQNCLIDILLISLLKHSLPIQNQDNQLNIGDWKNQDINPGVLFQGLCNQFDLIFQQDKDNLIYKIYLNTFIQNQPSQSISQEMLLQSRSKQQQIDVSLLPKNNNFNSCSQSQLSPIFKIWNDPSKQYYRTNISIRPQKYTIQQQYEQNESFHRTQKSISEICDKSLSIPQIKQQLKNPLIPRDINVIQRLKKYQQSDYLKQKIQSINISMNNSYLHQEHI